MSVRKLLVTAISVVLLAGVTTPARAEPANAERDILCAVPPDRDIAVTKIVYEIGKGRSVSDKVMLAAFEAGWVESHMNNLPCGDSDSLGVFQQRPSQGWGTAEQIMDVRYATTKFFQVAQQEEPKWPGLSAGRLADKVQRSCCPERYDQAESKARSLLAEAKSLLPGLIDNDLPRFQSSGQVVAVPSLDGRLEMFAGGGDGVWHRYQTAVNGGWSSWSQVGGVPGARLGIGRSADGRLELFAVNDEQTLHRYQTAVNGGWSDWIQIGGGGTDITVAPAADGRLEVFLAGHEQVWHHYQRSHNGDWSGWTGIGGPGLAHFGVGRSGDGRLEVFAVNHEQTLHRYQTAVNGGWSDWIHAAGGGTDITVAPAADGRLEVFLAGHDQIWHRYQKTHQGDWTTWTPTGGLPGAQITASRNTDGRLDIATTNGTATHQNWQTSPNHGLAGWADLHGRGRDLNLATNHDGRLEIHLTGDDQIWTRHQQQPNGHWTTWNPTGGPPNP